jgi:hypothetical protein
MSSDILEYRDVSPSEEPLAVEAEESFDGDSWLVPASLRRPSSVRDQPDAISSFERLAKILDGLHFRFLQGTLPCSLADLEQLGVDQEILDLLVALVAGGAAEEKVVRAFLEALESAARQAGASRQLLRALRNQFKNEEECADVRRSVRAVVGGTSVATP